MVGPDLGFLPNKLHIEPVGSGSESILWTGLIRIRTSIQIVNLVGSEYGSVTFYTNIFSSSQKHLYQTKYFLIFFTWSGSMKFPFRILLRTYISTSLAMNCQPCSGLFIISSWHGCGEIGIIRQSKYSSPVNKQADKFYKFEKWNCSVGGQRNGLGRGREVWGEGRKVWGEKSVIGGRKC